MFNDTVECPYCEHENDMSDALSDGLSNDNKLDWECSNCEEEFEVNVEFEPSYSASKIIYTDCGKCGKPTRDILQRGRILPWPEYLQEDIKICRPCFQKAWQEEHKKE